MLKPVICALVALLMVALVHCGAVCAVAGPPKGNSAESCQWIQVPDWLAGTWQARFQTFIDTYDCSTGKQSLQEPLVLQISGSRTIGTQRDLNGQIWHYAATPYVRNLETEEYVESQTIEHVSLLNSEPRQLKVCTVGAVTRWSKITREKIDTFYERTVTTYEPMSEGVIKVDLIITDFDLDAKPLRHSQSVRVERRIRPFSAIDRDERGNLKEKFNRFMSETKSAD